MRRVPAWPAFARACVLVACLAMRCAVAADWTYLDDNADPGDLSPAVAVASPDGFALLGRSGGRNAFVRYAANAQPQAARYLGEDFPSYAAFAQLIAATPLADGGFLGLFVATGPLENPVCLPVRFRADGSVLWQGDFITPFCKMLGSDAGNGFWLASGNAILRYSADGSLVRNMDVAESGSFAGVVDTASGTLYASANSAPGGLNALTVYRVDAPPQQVWVARDAQTALRFIALGGDGNLYALGSSNGHLYALSLTRDGSVRWEKQIPGTLQAGAAFADGRLLALDQSETLYEIGTDGSVLLDLHIIPEPCPRSGCGFPDNDRLAVAANGDVVVLLSGVPEVLRVDAQGNQRAAEISNLSYMSDDASLLALADGTVLAGPLHSLDGSDAASFARVAADASRPGDPPVLAVLHGQQQVSVVTQDGAGAAYVLSVRVSNYLSSTDSVSWLSKISPDGHLVWKQTLPGNAPYFPGFLQAGADRVCFETYHQDSTTHDVQCRAASDGAQSWLRTSHAVQAAALLDDGNVVVLSGDGLENSHLTLVAPDGAVQRDTALPQPFNVGTTQIAIAANGTTIVSSLLKDNTVYAWDRNGVALYAVPPPSLGEALYDRSVSVDDDGSAVLLIDGASAVYAWRLAPNGQTSWVHALGYGAQIAGIAGGSVYAVDYVDYPNDAQVQKFAVADGTLQSRATLPQQPPPYVLPTLDRASGLLISRSFAEAHIGQFVLIDPADGRRVRTVLQDCGGAPCSFSGLFAAIGADGTLRTVLDQPMPSGERFRVDATLHAATSPPRVRVDQAGLDGAWFAPYETGQGFTLDYIASANTIFMPWFTYGIDTTLTPANLAWYTLQGTVTNGATHADLVMARADPGAFDNGNVGVQRVGTASLEFSDCNSGLLFYQFDAEEFSFGFGGVIALSRLSPSTLPCVLADGSSAPAQITTVAAQGFDARQSGSWFEPATAGQGLQITVIPRGNGFGGLLFAAWFTFDPDGASDDDAREHWFTLQNDLSAATVGSVQLPILRTIGGAFDASPTSDTAQVGHATLTFHGCDRASLDYAFDPSELAHAFAGRQGSVELVKIGGCSPP